MINRGTKKKMWSQEDTMKLFKMAKEGATFEDILATFPDRKEGAIANKLHRQGFSAARGKSYERT